MNTLALATTVLVLLGALFMIAAVLRGGTIRGRVPRELQPRWRVMVALMLFFLSGYVSLIVILVSNFKIPIELITGPVFLGGAFFVFIVINLTRDTISRATSAEEGLRLLNGALEQRIKDRTRELRRSHEFLRTVLESLNDEVIIINVDDFRVVGTNAAFLADNKLTAEEVLGRTCHEITHNRKDVCSPPDDICPLLETVKTGRHAAAEHVHYDKNGDKIYAEVSTSPIRDKDGRVVQVVHVSRDITERKMAEKALQESEQRLLRSNEGLQEINEELKNFAYIVSHDLRAPLVNIKDFSEELLNGIKEISPALEAHLERMEAGERRKYGVIIEKDIPEALTFIGSSVSRMDNLINAILQISRAGRRKLNPEPLRTKQVVRDVLNALAHQIESRAVSVTIGELPDLFADRTAVEQIFGNLLDNAVKYFEPGRTGVLAIRAERGDTEIIFHVRDNGRGIAEEDIPRAFEIFRRVGKQDVPGEGIGLAYVKMLVRTLGGRIWCESEPGVGTEFIFSIPALVNESDKLSPTGG